MIIKEITDYLESIAPLRFQESYDNAGLIVGDPEMKVTGAIISLDATEEVVDDAIARGCNMVISHHPIIFKGIKKFNPNYYVDRAVIKAIKNDIALYAIHTNLDNVLQHGVNEKIAQRMSLVNIQTLKPHALAPMESAYEVGSGALGDLETSMDGASFIAYLKDKMQLKNVRHTKILDSDISKVALCGGAGSFLLPSAIAAGAQVFVSADYKYHEFFDANDQVMIVDIGHYESEHYTIELIHQLVSKKFPNFAAHYTKVMTNPVFYS